uniref:Uncharacterized LOC114652763 n=1 Tax=Erpetoichthys calabaricus TaxID=27687 RepID=A0A8C4RLG7_ERPCA
MYHEDQESSPPKKIKRPGESELKISNRFSIRISDGFIRTVGNVIAPLVAARASLQIIRELRGAQLEETLVNVLRLCSAFIRQIRSGSIIIDAEFLKQPSALNVADVIQKLKSEMKTIMPAGNCVIEEIKEKEHHHPEPKVQEMDLAFYTLQMLKKELGRMKHSRLAEVLDFQNAEEMISRIIKESQSSTKVCLLSQNGKGKSFILNLLLLMTADNDEEYQEYIKNNEGILPLTQEHLMGNSEIIPEVFAEELEKYEDEIDSDQKKEIITKMIQNCDYTSSVSEKKMSEMIKAEEKSFSALKKYCGGMNLRHFQSYLLPEKGTKKAYMATTKAVVRLRYGRIYQMKVEYMNKEDLQNQLYELAEIKRNRKENKRSGRTENKQEEMHHDALQKRFEILTTHFQQCSFNEEDLLKLENSNCILLNEAVNTFEGSTAYFMGLGKNATEDRLFIREKLQEMITLTNVSTDQEKLHEMKIAAVKEIVVFAPCKLLCGQKELIEMPGTDESDPLALHDIGNILDEVNGTLLLSDSSFNIGEADVKTILRDSKFLHNFVKSPEEYMLMFITYPEQKKNSQYTKEDKIMDMEFVKEEPIKKEGEIQCLERLLEKQLPENVKKNVNSSVILPVFHCSLLMQEHDTTEIVREFESNLEHTGVYKVMETLDQFGFINLKPKIEEAKDALILLKERAEHYLKMCERVTNQAEDAMKSFRKREMSELHFDNFFKQHEEILVATTQSLNTTRYRFIDGQVAELLQKWGRSASEKWKENKEKVTAMCVFNPIYNGKRSKIKLYNIAYGRSDELDMNQFLDDTRNVMIQYKVSYKFFSIFNSTNKL